jgi:hypothetical protein
MKRLTFWLTLVSVLFVWLMPQVFSSNFGLPLREVQASMLASLAVGFGLAFKLTPKIRAWDGFRYLNGLNTMFLFLGMVWLIRTVVVLQGVGIWPLVAIAVVGSLFGFVVGSLEFRRVVREPA